MKIHNPLMLILAIIQLGSCFYYIVKLNSPMLGWIQFFYAISNILFSLMKGL